LIGALVAKRKVRAAFLSFNDRDIPTFLESWAEDANFVYPGGVSASGSAPAEPMGVGFSPGPKRYA